MMRLSHKIELVSADEEITAALEIALDASEGTTRNPHMAWATNFVSIAFAAGLIIPFIGGPGTNGFPCVCGWVGAA